MDFVGTFARGLSVEMFVRRASRALGPMLGMGAVLGLSGAHAAASSEDEGLFVVNSALSKSEFRAFPVTHVSTMEDGSRRVRFGLAARNDELGLCAASSMIAQGEVDGESSTGSRRG